MIPNYDYSEQIRVNRNHNDNRLYVKKPVDSSQSSSTQKNQPVYVGEIPPHELFKQTLEYVGVVDNDGVVTKEALKGYKPDSLDDTEFKGWFDFVCEPRNANFGIKFSLIEFYAFLFTVAPKVGITITSTNLFGGAVPYLFESYFTRTCNELYKNQCKNRNVLPSELITHIIESTFKRKPPDYDLVTGMEGDLIVANSLITKFFSWKLANVNHFQNYNLKSALEGAQYFANILVQNFPNLTFFITTPYPEQEKAISEFQAFYYDYFDSKKPEFSLASFGVDCKIDHNFVSTKNVGNTYFLPHALRIPYLDQAIGLINLIRFSTTQFSMQKIIEILPKITPVHEYLDGVQAILDRTAMCIRIVSEVNDRALGGYISLISRGYTNVDPDLPNKLFNKIKNDGHLTLLKKTLINHHSKTLLEHIVFGFNALNCLPVTSEHSQKCHSWWEVMMSWYDAEILEHKKAATLVVKEQQKPPTQFVKEKPSGFFLTLKATLGKNEISFGICRDILQMYGCLNLSSSKDRKGTAFKVQLRNLEGPQADVAISQTIDSNTHTISVHLNLHEALESILQLDDIQVDLLSDLIKHLSPTAVYDRKLISTKIFNKKLADRAVDCFDKSHLAIKKLGYELLLLYSLSNPEFEIWVLRNLIKYSPLIIGDPLTIGNLKLVLDACPKNEEIDKLISPWNAYCQNYKDNFKNGCFDLCMSLANSEQSSTAVSLYSRLQVSADDQLKFLKAILFKEPLEAIKLFCTMQKQNSLSDKEEVENFVVIVKSIQKSCREISYVSLLRASVDCVKGLFRKEYMGPVLRPVFEPLIEIVMSLCRYGFGSNALDLLEICSNRGITLVNTITDNETWMTVCEAGFIHPEVDVEDLYNKWLARCSRKCTDQNMVAKIKDLESKFQKCLYEKYRDILLALQNTLKDSSIEDRDKLNQDIQNCNTDILKLLGSPGLLECTYEFLKQMANCPLNQQQAYIDLALKLTLELTKSEEHSEKIIELDGVVKTYLDAVKDSDKEYSVRQVSLIIAKKLLAQKLPDEAMKWMHRIFRIAIKNNPAKIAQSQLFDVKGKSIPLLSFNLPANPVKLLDTIARMPERELDVYKKLMKQRPCSKEISSHLKGEQRTYLAKKAKDCLTHNHSIVQRLGFELTMVCAVTMNGLDHAVIDMPLLDDLILYLPLVLGSSKPALREKILDRLKSLLKLSAYSSYSDDFIVAIPTETTDIKPLYQACCIALALTKHKPLFEIGKKLIEKHNIIKFAPSLSQKDKNEIVLSYLHGLLPENGMFAIDCLKKYESDLSSTSCKNEKRNLDIALIKAFIKSTNLEKAMEHLTSCIKNFILLKQEPETTELWVCLYEKFMQEALPDYNFIAKHWSNLLSNETISKIHSSEMQIKLLISLIGHLFDLKNEVSAGLARKLIVHMKGFNPGHEQKETLFHSIETHIQSKISKNDFFVGYQELKSESGLYLPENLQLIIRKAFLSAAIDYEFHKSAIELLTVLQVRGDDQVVANSFDSLLTKLFKVENEAIVDDERALQAYQLLKNVDIKSKQPVRCKYVLQWLVNAELYFESKYEAERIELLKVLLQSIKGGFLPRELFLETVKQLLKIFKSVEFKDQSNLTELKELISSCHSEIAQELQSEPNLEIFCEYLFALHQHLLSKKNISIVWPQICWMADQYLKKGDFNSVYLLIIHQLLSTPHSNRLTDVDRETAIQLATALLAQNLPQQAIRWIEKSISTAKIDHDLPIIKWCKSLLAQNQAKLCVSLLKELKNVTDQALVKAELYLQVSKSLLENDTAISAQLLIDNWEFLRTNCASEVDLREYLKCVIRKIFLCHQDVDFLPLYSSLMDHCSCEDEEFIIEQLNSCCRYIDTPPKNINSTVHSANVCDLITSLFFKPKKILQSHLQRIKILAENKNGKLAPVKILILKDYLLQTFLNSILPVEDQQKISAVFQNTMKNSSFLNDNSSIILDPSRINRTNSGNSTDCVKIDHATEVLHIESQAAQVAVKAEQPLKTRSFAYIYLPVSNRPILIALYLSVLKDLESLRKDSKIDSRELKALNTYYTLFIKNIPIGESPDEDKKLSFTLLENALYMHSEGLQSTIIHIRTLLDKYHGDPLWLEKCTSLIIDMIIGTSMKSNDYLLFIETYALFLSFYVKSSINAANRFLTEFLEKSSNLQDSHMRALMFRLTFDAICDLTKRYQLSVNTNNIRNEDSSLVNNLNATKETRDIFCHLVERLLFCHPLFDVEYSIDIDTKKYVITEHTYSYEPRDHLLSKHQLNEKEKNQLNRVIDLLPEGDEPIKCLALNEQTFEFYYDKLLKTLTEHEFKNSHFDLMLMLQLVSTKEFVSPVNMDKSVTTESFFSLFRSMPFFEHPPSNVYAAFSTLINHYISHDHPAVKEKALSLFQNIPQCLWESHLNEVTGLLINVMNNKHLYQKRVARIIALLESSNLTNKGLPGWAESCTKLCFHFFDCLNKFASISDDKVQLPFELAFQFFPKALDNGLISSDHPEFMHQFKSQMQKVSHMYIVRSTSIAVAHLLESSIEHNPKYKNEIMDYIRQNYSQIMVLKPEYLNDNAYIALLLSNEGHFASKEKEHEALLKKFIEQFEARFKEPEFPEIHMNFLMAIFPQFKNLEQQHIKTSPNTIKKIDCRIKGVSPVVSINILRTKLHKIIDEHINNIIPIIPTPENLENNINIVDLLVRVKYFDNSADSIILLENYKDHFMHQFKQFSVLRQVPDSLLAAMPLLFTQKEIDYAQSLTEMCHQPLQPLSESPFEFKLTETHPSGGRMYDVVLKNNQGP